MSLKVSVLILLETSPESDVLETSPLPLCQNMTSQLSSCHSSLREEITGLESGHLLCCSCILEVRDSTKA